MHCISAFKASALALLGALSLTVGCTAARIENRDACDNGSKQTARASKPSIELTGWVTDEAGILDASVESSLSSKLEVFESVTGHQLVVVTVFSLNGRDAKDYTTDLHNAWGIGRAEQDDGVVFLVAPKDRKVRISTGCGLGRALPDGEVQRILNDKVLPQFQRGEISRGVESGVDALIEALK